MVRGKARQLDPNRSYGDFEAAVNENARLWESKGIIDWNPREWAANMKRSFPRELWDKQEPMVWEIVIEIIEKGRETDTFLSGLFPSWERMQTLHIKTGRPLSNLNVYGVKRPSWLREQTARYRAAKSQEVLQDLSRQYPHRNLSPEEALERRRLQREQVKEVMEILKVAVDGEPPRQPYLKWFQSVDSFVRDHLLWIVFYNHGPNVIATASAVADILHKARSPPNKVSVDLLGYFYPTVDQFFAACGPDVDQVYQHRKHHGAPTLAVQQADSCHQAGTGDENLSDLEALSNAVEASTPFQPQSRSHPVQHPPATVFQHPTPSSSSHGFLPPDPHREEDNIDRFAREAWESGVRVFPDGTTYFPPNHPWLGQNSSAPHPPSQFPHDPSYHP